MLVFLVTGLTLLSLMIIISIPIRVNCVVFVRLIRGNGSVDLNDQILAGRKERGVLTNDYRSVHVAKVSTLRRLARRSTCRLLLF